jgi:type I site-specific restriction endonuclease
MSAHGYGAVRPRTVKTVQKPKRRMNKRQQQERLARRKLKNAGWDVSKTDSVEFNSGSETTKHVVGKTLVAKVGKDQGYRVCSEVEHDDRGEIDIVLYGRKDEAPVAIELETNPQEDTISDKVERYVRGTPIRDILLINLDDMPTDIDEAEEWIQTLI